MNLRIAAVALLLFAPACFAQKSYSNKPSAGERAGALESLQQGKEIRGSGARYRVLPEVQAVEQGAGTPARAPSDAQVLETKGKMVFYRSAVGKLAARGADGAFPAVINLRNGALGALTDTLIVRPKSMADADAIAASHGLEKTKAYPQMQTVFYKAKPGADIADVSAALQADSRIEIAYPEIIENVRVPK